MRLKRLKQVAAELGVSYSALKSWAMTGKISVGRSIGGKVFLMSADQVDELRRRLEGEL